MKITFADQDFEFRPWNPALGQVFAGRYSFDSETTLIDDERPWLAPAYVLGAAFDGRRGYYVRRDDAGAFFLAHAGAPVVLHNAAFDLRVIDILVPEIDIYQLVDQDRVWDTQLLHRLYMLGTTGHTASGKGESTLDTCAETYLGVALPKDVTDSVGDQVRLSYSKWLNRPPADIEPVYLEYLAMDVIATLLVYSELRARLEELLRESQGVWGFVSPDWLDEQVGKWGPQTHHIQLKASIVLREIGANGLHLDWARKDELARELKAKSSQLQESLRRFGYLPAGEGSQKSLAAVLSRLEREQKSCFPRTETGKYATSYEALQDFADSVPFIKLLLEYRATEKLIGSFVGKMAKQVLHPSFNVLARTGRTTSFGEINAQNLPKEETIRACFVPSPGHVFIDADYKTIELATLASACVSQFGLDSQMATVINAGEDLHTLVAAAVKGTGKSAVTKSDRAKAKAINFGKPGGMGNATLQQYAKASYGIELDDAEVAALSDAWFDLFPEMREFLADDVDMGLEVAGLLDISLATHYEHAGDDRFIRHADHAAHLPHAILGWMCLKALATDNPQTRNGRPYSAADIDFFWSQVEAQVSLFSERSRKAIRQREPSVRLQRELKSLVGRAPVFTLSGRLRANATYCARHNTVFQGLAADGAKVALWRLWRAGYRIVNFIHDEVLVEVPEQADLKQEAESIRRLMIAGMEELVPRVLVDVSFAAMRRWCKDAEAIYDEPGKRLIPWEPPAPAKVA